MSVKVMALVWDADLPPMEKLVLLALADRADDDGKCWPSANTLARKTGAGERTVRRTVQSLISKGVIKQEQRNGTSPIYTVNPCQSGTPARTAPLPERPPTPARVAPNTSGNIISSEPKGSSPRVKFLAPPGVSIDQWKPFCKQRKKALNERSYLLLCNKLLKVSAESGWPPGDLIDLATERGWETVFAPRKFSNERSNSPSPLDQLVAASLGFGARTS